MEKRRAVIVPKTKEAEFALDYEEATEDQLFTLTITKKYYQEFWASGLLDLMNHLSPQSLIEDYEEACINDPALIALILTALKNKKGYAYDIASELADTFIILFEEALEKKTGVYFYL